MTLNDLERSNGRYSVFFTKFGRFGADYIKVVEDRPIQSAIKNVVQIESSFRDISFMALFA